MDWLRSIFVCFVPFWYTFLLFLIFVRGLCPTELPEGWGLSANYPGDVGIASDRDVLLTEDFERGNLAELKERWSSLNNQGESPGGNRTR